MNVLLDTHTFIWWAQDPGKLSRMAASICNDPQNRRYLSLVSVWEMQIKIQAGKLTISPSLYRVVAAYLQTDQIKLLPIELAHIFALAQLPYHHRDPFDRLLVAQALHDKMPLLSGDPLVAHYAAQVLW